MSNGNPAPIPLDPVPARPVAPQPAPAASKSGFIGLSELADTRLTAADLFRVVPAAILSICLNAGLVIGLMAYNADAQANNEDNKKQTITTGDLTSKTTIDDTPVSKPPDFIALNAGKVETEIKPEVDTKVPDVLPKERKPDETGGLEPPPPELKDPVRGIGTGDQGGIQGVERTGREGLDSFNLTNAKVGALPTTTGNAPIGDGSGLWGADGAGLRTNGGFGHRFGDINQLALREGATEESQRAVARGLEWLARHQATNGRWSLDKYNEDCKGCTCKSKNEHARPDDTAATALALMAFLGAGHTHLKKESPYHGVVLRGLNFLIRQQDSRGAFQGGGQPMYSHALGAIAICEAYAMTQDGNLRRPAQKAVDYLVYAQNPADGGWRYTARSPDSDTSVVGWCVMALKSAQLGGLAVPSNTMELCKKWLDSCASDGGSRYSYMGRGEGGPSMTSVGLLCRQYLGWGQRNPDLIKGAKFLLATSLPPEKESVQKTRPRLALYTYYYATQVMHHMEGEFFDAWNPRMRDVLVATQNVDQSKHTYGSWDPEFADYGGHAGRIYSTTLAVLTLEVYYRHMPLYRSSGNAQP
jgi:hypothetical protein